MIKRCRDCLLGVNYMTTNLSNILYNVDKDRFDKVSDMAKSYNATCNGNNIVQDDIFNVIRNYGYRHGWQIEIIRMPVNDDDFCACTFVRKERIFIVSNSYLPAFKQIFAAAHELYHVIRYVNGDDEDFPFHGTILKTSQLDEKDVEAEDREANAFAGLFLVPRDALMEQISIYHISVDNFTIRDAVVLMDIFACPYKAVILRLYEEKLLTSKKAEELLVVDNKIIENEIDVTGIASRWCRNENNIIELGSLKEKLLSNEMKGLITDDRAASDKITLGKLIEDIKKCGA